MNIDQPDLEAYLLDHTTGESTQLREINRRTYLEMLYPRMLSGPIMGQFLSMISQMVKPRTILEIGTFTGYSTLCLAKGLPPNGLLHTIEINEELKDINANTFENAGYKNQIIQHIGDALTIIPQLGMQFDLVFLDADKLHYPDYFLLIMDHMPAGAFLVADNVLWNGKVLSENSFKMDKDARGIMKFNDMVQADERVENVMLTIRDGIMLIRKIR